MIDSMKEQIEQKVKEGKTIVDICEELDLEWKDVSKFLHSVDKKSWQGAKKARVSAKKTTHPPGRI